MEINNVLIVDDHDCIIDGIISELREEFKLNNISIANTPEEAIEQVANNKFDLCILDLDFRSERLGISFEQINYIRKICEIDPHTRSIVFTMREDFETIKILTELVCVKGVVLNGADKKCLQKAVRVVMNGGRYFCPGFKNRCKQYKKNRIELKETDIRILKLLGQGMCSKEIAKELGYKISTVVSYRRDLKEKMNANSTAQMIIIAIVYGYIRIEYLREKLLIQEGW